MWVSMDNLKTIIKSLEEKFCPWCSEPISDHRVEDLAGCIYSTLTDGKRLNIEYEDKKT